LKTQERRDLGFFHLSDAVRLRLIRFRKDKAAQRAYGERSAAYSSPTGKEEWSILNRIHLFTLRNKLYLYCIV
jgi:hypothetical protein